jgi:hypothetical protein
MPRPYAGFGQTGGGDDQLMQLAWNRIGDYYADRQKWSKAVQYYTQAKNSEVRSRAASCRAPSPGPPTSSPPSSLLPRAIACVLAPPDPLCQALIDCFYILEDFEGLEALISRLPDLSPLLNNIGVHLQSVRYPRTSRPCRSHLLPFSSSQTRFPASVAGFAEHPPTPAMPVRLVSAAHARLACATKPWRRSRRPGM